MKTYLFDFDGTLVDSMPTFVSVMLRILDENGIKYPDDVVKTITPLGYHGTAKYLIELGVKMKLEEITAKMTEYATRAYRDEIGEKTGVIDTLKKLKARGDDLNILTASPHTMLDPCLKRLGIYELFTNVWSCDDFGTTKADPEIYRAAAKRMGVEVEDVIFLDDNLSADTTAKSAGVTVVGVYDESSKDFESEMKATCHRYVYTLSELLED